MAQKVKLTADLQSISGKEGRNSNVIVSLSKKSGKMVRYTYVKPRDVKSTAQVTKRALFSTIAKNLGAWWQSQKPTTAAPTGTASYIAVQAAFKADNEFDNVFSFLRAKYVSSAGVLTVGSTTVNLATGSTPTQGGGGSTEEI